MDIFSSKSEIRSGYAEQWCSRRRGYKKRKTNYKCMWAGSLCGLSAGLKNQRMKVRHLPGPPIQKTVTAKILFVGSNPVFFQKRIGAMVDAID